MKKIIPTPKITHILVGSVGSNLSLAVHYLDVKRAIQFIMIMLIITIMMSIILQVITNKIIGEYK